MLSLRKILVICLITALSGCAPLHSTRFGGQALLSSQHYLSLAKNATGEQQQQYLMLAAQRYLQDHQIRQAQKILAKLDPNLLSPPLVSQRNLLLAEITIAKKQYRQALSMLNQFNLNGASPEQQALWYQLNARAYLGLNNVVQSINIRGQLATLLPHSSPSYQQNLKQIWLSLQKLSPWQITQLKQKTASAYIQGWLSLATTINQVDNNPQHITAALTAWKTQYPDHIANGLLPNSTHIKAINNQKIALLIPLSGRFGASGQAIRNGFFAAYYYWKNRLNAPPSITVINTANQDINQAYQAALQSGATLIVGPLTKPNIQSLINHASFAVPTLALNSVDTAGRTINNLYEFGLSPLDEAKQAADRAIQAQHHNAIIITSNNNWGQNIANAFKDRWQQQGGTVIAQLNYTTRAKLAADIRHLFNLDDAKQRATALQSILGEKLRYFPRRRKDFDVIFLAANNLMAKQIRPLLSFYYAGSIPVYAISPVYIGNTNVRRDRDLNGILFCDIPWVLNRNQLRPPYLQSIFTSIQKTWPQELAGQPKLYALGVDAFDLSLKINKMLMLPQLGTNAATGTLYLQSDHHIYRELPWAMFSRGRAELIH